MADPTPAELFVLDMLGPELKAAVLGARERLADDTVMARIAKGLVYVERGDPLELFHAIEEEGVVVAGALSYEDAITFLGGLA